MTNWMFSARYRFMPGLLLLLMMGAMVPWAQAQLALGPLSRIAGSDAGQGGDVGQYAAFDEDGFGGQHIVYYDATYRQLKYARRPRLNRPWRIEVLDAGPDAGRYATLAMGPPRVKLQAQAFFTNGSNVAQLYIGQNLTDRIVGGRVKIDTQATWYEITDVINTTTLELNTPYTGPTTNPADATLEFYQPVVAYQKTNVATNGTALMLAIPQSTYQYYFMQVDPPSGISVLATHRRGYYASVAVGTTGTIHLVWQNRDFDTTPVGQMRYLNTRTTDSSFLTFNYSTPDGTLGRGAHARVALDGFPEQQPSVLYYDESNHQLWSSRFVAASGLWQPFPVDNTSGLDPGTAADMKFWPGGNKHVIGYQRQLLSGTGDGGMAKTIDLTAYGYQVQATPDELTTGTNMANFVAVATGAGALDRYHLFYDGENQQLLFRQALGTTFTAAQALDTRIDPGRYVSAGVNPVNSQLYAAYYDAGASALKLAHWNGLTASSEYVDGVKYGSQSSIGRTSTEVVVAYYSDVEACLRVARWPIGTAPGGPGSSDVIVDNLTYRTGEYPSLVVDGNDRIFVTYLDRTRGELRFAGYNQGVWYKHDVAPATSSFPRYVGEHNRLAINPAGTQIMAVFYNSAEQTLHYARADLPAAGSGDPFPTDFQDKPLGTPMGTGEFCSIDYAPGGDVAYIAYFNNNTQGLDFATFDGTTATIETVEQGIFNAAGYYTSVVANPLTNAPMIAYYDISNGALNFAEKSGSLWTLTTLDNVADTGYYPALKADSAHNVLYLVYYAPQAGELRAMTRALAGGTWSDPVALATNYRGLRPSIQVTPDGRLELSFFDEARGDLLTSATGEEFSLNAARPGWAQYQ
jgi:hypothetical protein